MEPGARALLHANQPSLRLPAALPPSSQPPSSALPPPACGAPSFPAGPPPPPPPPPASCSLAFPRVLPAAGKWNSATTIASLAGREPPRSPPRASSAGPGRKFAEGQSHPAPESPGPARAQRPPLGAAPPPPAPPPQKPEAPARLFFPAPNPGARVGGSRAQPKKILETTALQGQALFSRTATSDSTPSNPPPSPHPQIQSLFYPRSLPAQPPDHVQLSARKWKKVGASWLRGFPVLGRQRPHIEGTHGPRTPPRSALGR